jgi:serine phosphatase RsbU (regulator of sigma subunit)
MPDHPKILLVDDEPFNLDYLEQELEGFDLEIVTASDGKQALESIAERQPDMIFLDIMMPVMDGFEVLKRLKANPLWNAIPVVIISASNDLRSVVKGISMGAEDFLPKPFEPVLLHARLKASLEKKRLHDLEQRYLQALERELQIGREIQAGFLPTHIPQPPGWEIEAFFRPAREVAGDYYDVFEMGDGRLALMLGDVTDKGVGAALYMALFRSLLRALATLETCDPQSQASAMGASPAARLVQAVSAVNEYICSVHDSAMFTTLFFAVLDTRSGELCYLNAGHDQPYLLKENSIRHELSPSGPLVGAFAEAVYETRSLQFEPGERLVLYSDGIPDARNPAGEMFMKERWLGLLQKPPSGTKKWIEQLTAEVLDFIGPTAQYDDISLLIVRRI